MFRSVFLPITGALRLCKKDYTLAPSPPGLFAQKVRILRLFIVSQKKEKRCLFCTNVQTNWHIMVLYHCLPHHLVLIGTVRHRLALSSAQLDIALNPLVKRGTASITTAQFSLNSRLAQLVRDYSHPT